MSVRITLFGGGERRYGDNEWDREGTDAMMQTGDTSAEENESCGQQVGV